MTSQNKILKSHNRKQISMSYRNKIYWVIWVTFSFFYKHAKRHIKLIQNKIIFTVTSNGIQWNCMISCDNYHISMLINEKFDAGIFQHSMVMYNIWKQITLYKIHLRKIQPINHQNKHSNCSSYPCTLLLFYVNLYTIIIKTNATNWSSKKCFKTVM